MSGTRTFAELLKTVQLDVLDAIDHRVFTFGDLVRELHLEREPNRMPITPIMFNLASVSDVDLMGLETEMRWNTRRHENFEMAFNVVPRSDSLRIECSFNAALFDESSVRTRLDELAAFLAAAVAGPDIPIEDIELMPADERRRVESRNMTQRELPAVTVPELFEARAAAHPDSVAVMDGGAEFTYGELSRRSDRIAHELVARGIGTGDLVGICLSRGFDMVASLLGVLKSGAAYVPIDPGFPALRRSFMMADSGLTTVVAEPGLAGRLGRHDWRHSVQRRTIRHERWLVLAFR